MHKLNWKLGVIVALSLPTGTMAVLHLGDRYRPDPPGPLTSTPGMH